MTDEEFFHEVIKPVIYNFLPNATRTIEAGRINANKTAKIIKDTYVKVLTIDTPIELVEPVQRLQQQPLTVFANMADNKAKNILHVRHQRFICFVVGLHWFYKKRFNKRHDIPCKKPFAKILEPNGEYYTALFNLCSEVHIIKGIKDFSVFEWFEQILFELRDEWIFAPIPPTEKVTTKQDDIKRMTQDLIGLRNNRNTIDKNKLSVLYELIQSAIDISKSKFHVDFRVGVWQQYLIAFDHVINGLKSPEIGKFGTDEDGNLYIVQYHGNKKSKNLLPIA